MRRGDLVFLEWSNIDWQAETARLDRTKNGTKRVVPLTPEAVTVLREIRGRSLSEKKVITISAVGLRIARERAKRRAKIRDFRFHDLSHEAISRFFEIGLSVPEVALIAGHKTATMLFRYNHLRPEDVGKKLRNSIAASKMKSGETKVPATE